MALTDKKVFDEKGGFELTDLRGEKLHMVSIRGAELHGVDARDTSLVHVNFVGSKWNHIYFSNVHINETQLGGTVFENIRRPDAAESRFEEEAGTDGWVNVEPVTFRTSDLSKAVFEECDLSDADFRDCKVDTMRINGVPVSELMKIYEEHRALPQSVKDFRQLREETISFAESVPADKLDLIPEGYSNSIRWNLGHLLAAWDHGIFPKLGGSWRIPTVYHSMFPNGTSPRDWRSAPPSLKEIVRQLRDQKEQITLELPSHLDYPLAEPFLNMSTMAEMLEFLLNEEQHHQRTMRAIAEALENGAAFEPTPAVPAAVKLPPFAVVGVSFEANLKEINEQELGRKAFEEVMARRDEIEGRLSEDVYLVQIYPQKMNFNPHVDPFTQLIGYKVEHGSAAGAPDGLAKREFEEKEYVSYTHRGPESELGRTYDLLYGRWMGENDRRPCGYDFEIWGSRYKPDQPDNEIDLYIALAPK
ncbi:DinB family protein [Paenibacillus soyae]|uniref:DinB family protein n=1 Tax=Paenibacillus soyae TaxID=2969249 RepID=A0A9X2MRS2_9BACL|nr:DinB family protein [Paenibacillus soyae]MCR2804571.1 DinB family protein [Paenibacillus soyae]